MAIQYKAIEVRGLNQLNRALKNLGTPKAEIAMAGYEAALIVANDAKTEAPVRTGRLVKSIRAAKVQRGAVVRAGGARVPYANPIHWGWFYDRNNFVFKNIKPNAFFIRSMNRNYDEVLDTYIKNMEKLIGNLYDADRLRLKVK